MGFFKQTTQHGYSMGVIASMMQKAIRRSDEPNAMKAAVELSIKHPLYTWNRLGVILTEDCGLDMQLAAYVEQMRKQYWRLRSKRENSECSLALACAVMAMCRAEKNRITVQAYLVTKMEMKDNDFEIDIPDYAFDMHTAEGRKMGRGHAHFAEEGCKLVDPKSDEANLPDMAWYTKMFFTLYNKLGTYKVLSIPKSNLANLKREATEIDEWETYLKREMSDQVELNSLS